MSTAHVISGRYDVEAELARGGMGVVYRAFDRQLRQTVALKRLLAQGSSVERLTLLFEHEYQHLAQLSHPGIVEVYDYGVDRDGPYYTMELLAGRDLMADEPRSIRDACAILRDVASALALVHTRGLLHRDLSPANVRFSEQGRVKLIDFGALSPFGRQKVVVGTPAFIAPECLDAKAELDARADLYALGALSYWLLTRRFAVRARTIPELRRVLGEPIVPPSEYAPEISPALEELVLSLLHTDPLARPSSAAEVMDRLSTIAGLPAEAESERVALSYLAHPPLVGREALASALLSPFTRETKRGRAYVLSGNPGLGRSAVLGHVMLGARLSGATVLNVEARLQRGAFGVARALVRPALIALSDQLPWLIERHAEALALCAPELLPHGHPAQAPSKTSGAAERHARLLASMQEVLLSLCQRAPLCVVVDDVQRADQESQGLLAALAHSVEHEPLSVYVSQRSGTSWADIHAEAKFAERAAKVVLLPLDEEQLVELAQATFGKVANALHLGRFLHLSSGGVPLRALELLRLLVHDGTIRYENGSFNLPLHIDREVGRLDLDAAFSDRIQNLAPAERAAGELLCLFDDAVSLPELLGLTDLAEDSLIRALQSLCAQGLASVTDGQFSFVHDGVRTLFERSVSDARLRAVHLCAAEALLSRKQRSIDQVWQAGVFLMRGGQELRGARLIRDVTAELHNLQEGHGKLAQGMVRALSVLSAHGESDLRSARMLVLLCIAAYLDDARLFAPYLRRAFEALRTLSGTALAERLGRYLPPKLSLALGFAVARVRFAFTPRRYSFASFRELVSLLFTAAGAGVSAAIAAFDDETASYIVERLAPFRTLKSTSPANVVRDFCAAVGLVQRGRHPEAEVLLRSLLARLSDPELVAGMSEEVRIQILIGVHYGIGFAATTRGSPEVLEFAARMDGFSRAFYAPHAELLRYLHFALRGEQRRADEHRARAELLSIRGGSSWSAIHAMTYRDILVCQWTRDTAGLLRASVDLSRFCDVAPKMKPFRDLAQAYLEVLRGRPHTAIELYERVFAQHQERKLANWCMERGRYAEALIAVGRSGEAKQVCQEALAELGPDVKRFRFMYQSTLQALSLSEASLGDYASGAARLTALLEQPVESPLLTGALYRDRARIAVLARDAAAFLTDFSEMNERFRATQHPCLIRQCEALWDEAARVGLVPRGADGQTRSSLASSVRPTYASDSEPAPDTLAEDLDVTQREHFVSPK